MRDGLLAPLTREAARFRLELREDEKSRDKRDRGLTCGGAVRLRGVDPGSVVCSVFVYFFGFHAGGPVVFFVHHHLPEKWSLSPSLDTVRRSEEKNLWVVDFDAAWEGPL